MNWKPMSLVYGGCAVIGIAAQDIIVLGTFIGITMIIHGILLVVNAAVGPE